MTHASEDTDREIETGGETMSEIDTAGVRGPKTGIERRKLGVFNLNGLV